MAGIARRNGYYVDSFIQKFDECKDMGINRESAKAIMFEYALAEIRKTIEAGNRPIEIKKDIEEILRMLEKTTIYYFEHLENE
ncbi:MAG: hypothetical protein ACQEXX_01440 [Bacillota bacterium]